MRKDKRKWEREEKYSYQNLVILKYVLALCCIRQIKKTKRGGNSINAAN